MGLYPTKLYFKGKKDFGTVFSLFSTCIVLIFFFLLAAPIIKDTIDRKVYETTSLLKPLNDFKNMTLKESYEALGNPRILIVTRDQKCSDYNITAIYQNSIVVEAPFLVEFEEEGYSLRGCILNMTEDPKFASFMNAKGILHPGYYSQDCAQE